MNTNKRQILADTARQLFHQHGFAAVSVDRICREAAVSRPTFYKYFNGKSAIVQAVVVEQKNRVRAELEAVLAQCGTLESIADTFWRLQRESFAELYSAAFLHDMTDNTDLALERFFSELNEEKHVFLHGFFHTLQQRGLIRPDIPAELVGLFVRHADILAEQAQTLPRYSAEPQRLPQDILGLLLHGLAGEAV